MTRLRALRFRLRAPRFVGQVDGQAHGAARFVGPVGGQDAQPCLALENVSRDFGGLKAVDRVNLSIRAGERHAVIGPNGAGKTTL